jgi:hypothetical protein
MPRAALDATSLVEVVDEPGAACEEPCEFSGRATEPSILAGRGTSDVHASDAPHGVRRAELLRNVAEEDKHLQLLVVLRSCPHQNGVVEVVAMQILVVVRGTRVLGPSLGRVDAQVRFPEQPLGQLDQPGSDGKQAQLGTREGKDVDSIELVIAVALVPRISGVIRSAAT